MLESVAAIRVAVEQRFAQVTRSPGQEKKFRVRPASDMRLGYDPGEIDALSAFVTESFCGVGNPLGTTQRVMAKTAAMTPATQAANADFITQPCPRIFWRAWYTVQTAPLTMTRASKSQAAS